MSCLPLRQPEYNNVISHSSTSPPSPLPPLLLCLCLFVWTLYHLLTLLPSMSPCLSCSYFQSQTMHTHAHNGPYVPQTLFLFYPGLCSACLRHAPSLLFLSSLIYLTHPSSPSIFALDFLNLFPPYLFISTPLTTFLPPWNLSSSTPASPSPLHLLLFLY